MAVLTAATPDSLTSFTAATPDDLVLNAQRTFADVKVLYASYAVLKSTFPTYDDLLWLGHRPLFPVSPDAL